MVRTKLNKIRYLYSIKSINTISKILLTIILVKVVLHYAGFGFLEFLLFNFIPKWLLYILPSYFLLSRIIKRLPIKYSLIDFAMTTGGIYIIYFLITPFNLDLINWKVNYAKRMEIVMLAKSQQLVKTNNGTYEIPLRNRPFPYLFSRTVDIIYLENSTLTIRFYTDKGLLDHYSAFLYTNNQSSINELDKEVANGGNDHKLEENWYYINN